MCNSYFKIRTYCFLAFAACCILSASPAVAQTYFNDFETLPIGSEWSDTSTDITPVGARTFLGQFCNDTVSLTLTSVPRCIVTVSFELFIINTWDGHGDEILPENPSWGPDVWDLSVGDGPTLLNTTFATHEPRRQAYPDTYPGGLGLDPLHPHNTGAAEINTLGYNHDAVYNLSFTFAHAGGDLVLNFSAFGLQGLGDESWGLDNVLVYCPTEETEHIIEDIEEMGLPQGVENSLVSKLENAIDSMERGQYNAAANQLNAFINQVEAQRGKKITEEQADELIAAAQWIIDNISIDKAGKKK